MRRKALEALEAEFINKEYIGYDGKSVTAEWWVDEDSRDAFLDGETDSVECRVLPEGCDEEDKFSMQWDRKGTTYQSWTEG